MEKFSMGLPVTALLPEGDIIVLFYAGHEPDITDVRWVGIKDVWCNVKRKKATKIP